MGMIQQFFNNLRLVIMQSLSCIMPFCRCKYSGQGETSRGTQRHGNKDRRQFEHVVGSIYGNFDPQTGIPLHQDILNDRRHGKSSKKHKSVTKHRHHPVSKDILNTMPSEFDRDGEKRLFTNVSIMNMVLGERAATGSSLSMGRNTGDVFCSNKGHLSSDEADKEYSSSYNDGDKFPCPAKPCSKTNRQGGNCSPARRISFHDSVNPSTSDDNNNEPCQPKPIKNVAKNCGSPTKSNLRKLKLRIANNLENSCSCDNNSCPNSKARNEKCRSRSEEDTSGAVDNMSRNKTNLETLQAPVINKYETKCPCDNYASPSTSETNLGQPSQYKGSKCAFEVYISPSSSRIMHKTRQDTDNEAKECDHFFSPTTLQLRKKTNVCGDKTAYEKPLRPITSENDKTYTQTSEYKETNQRDSDVSPNEVKQQKNASPTRPRGLKITFDRSFVPRNSEDEKSFPETSSNDEKNKCDHKFIPNAEEINTTSGSGSNTNTSEDDRNPQASSSDNKEAKQKCCHFSPPTCKVKKETSPCALPKEVTFGFDPSSSNTSDEDKCRTDGKYRCDHKFSPIQEKTVPHATSNSQDDEPCDCQMSDCVCNHKPIKKVSVTKNSCHNLEKPDTDSDAITDLESGSDNKDNACACRKSGTCNCESYRKKNLFVNCPCNIADTDEYSTSDNTSEDVDSDVKSCKCSCHKRNKQLNIVYEHSLEANLFPVKNDCRHLNSILTLQPLSSTTESSNDERKSSDLTMYEEHRTASVNTIPFKCSCHHNDSIRKLSSSVDLSSDNYNVSNCNVCIADGRKLQIDEDGRNTNIPKCVINHLIDHNVTFHIVKVCDD